MDEAAVSTIHGWCQRMLREHAFDSGSLFTQTLETDHSELLGQVMRDYWRRFCYGMQGDALAWVRGNWGVQTPCCRAFAHCSAVCAPSRMGQSPPH